MSYRFRSSSRSPPRRSPRSPIPPPPGANRRPVRSRSRSPNDRYGNGNGGGGGYYGGGGGRNGYKDRDRNGGGDFRRRSRSNDRYGNGDRFRGGNNRYPDYIEEDHCRLHVGDLNERCSQQDLDRAFSRFGELREVWMARNPPSFAFIVFRYPKDAAAALREMDSRFDFNFNLILSFYFTYLFMIK